MTSQRKALPSTPSTELDSELLGSSLSEAAAATTAADADVPPLLSDPAAAAPIRPSHKPPNVLPVDGRESSDQGGSAMHRLLASEPESPAAARRERAPLAMERLLASQPAPADSVRSGPPPLPQPPFRCTQPRLSSHSRTRLEKWNIQTLLTLVRCAEGPPRAKPPPSQPLVHHLGVGNVLGSVFIENSDARPAPRGVQQQPPASSLRGRQTNGTRYPAPEPHLCAAVDNDQVVQQYQVGCWTPLSCRATPTKQQHTLLLLLLMMMMMMMKC